MPPIVFWIHCYSFDERGESRGQRTPNPVDITHLKFKSITLGHICQCTHTWNCCLCSEITLNLLRVLWFQNQSIPWIFSSNLPSAGTTLHADRQMFKIIRQRWSIDQSRLLNYHWSKLSGLRTQLNHKESSSLLEFLITSGKDFTHAVAACICAWNLLDRTSGKPFF